MKKKEESETKYQSWYWIGGSMTVTNGQENLVPPLALDEGGLTMKRRKVIPTAIFFFFLVILSEYTHNVLIHTNHKSPTRVWSRDVVHTIVWTKSRLAIRIVSLFISGGRAYNAHCFSIDFVVANEAMANGILGISLLTWHACTDPSVVASKASKSPLPCIISLLRSLPYLYYFFSTATSD